ncbi:MAG: hypothetical protein KH703_04050 [Campylobacter gracilis]|uniref:hypothetical protein n=1 Tax=Campylobacter gracilis TaxID=824 RepID=UPI0026EF3EF0|nr:hypothetical protein [Campylobacter gracilis]MBS6152571.1 hypothetical protein [Campylobacter gracilis]
MGATNEVMEQIDEKFNYPNINDVWRFCSSKVLKAAAMQSRNIFKRFYATQATC